MFRNSLLIFLLTGVSVSIAQAATQGSCSGRKTVKGRLQNIRDTTLLIANPCTHRQVTFVLGKNPGLDAIRCGSYGCKARVEIEIEHPLEKPGFYSAKFVKFFDELGPTSRMKSYLGCGLGAETP
jgi:hypothetical protein